MIFRKKLLYCSKINLGGGDFKKEGWCNLDMITGYDIGHKLLSDFGDECADVIFSTHFVEHIHPERARLLLKDAYRVLKSGGVIRISGPDCDILTAKVLLGEEAFMAFVDTFYDRNAMRADWLRWYLYLCGNPDKFGEPNVHPPTRHCWPVSASIMIYFLLCVGFDPLKIRRCSFRGSSVTELRGPEFDNRPEISFYVEAVK